MEKFYLQVELSFYDISIENTFQIYNKDIYKTAVC